MKKQKPQVIFGIRPVLEALDAGREIEKVLVRKSSSVNSEIMRDLVSRLQSEQIPFQYVPIEKLDSITRKNHQGVVAYVSEINYSDIDFILPRIFEHGKTPLILILDQVSDVRNFGAIARTAECAGVDAIVLPFKGSAMITAEAVKTSAGALHTIPVCRHDDLKVLVEYLKSSGLQIFAASEKAEKTLYDTDFTVPAAILLGSEEKGITPVILYRSDHLISIPLKGKIASLNVSVAAGVILYEVFRQRQHHVI
ncbi:MAG: 23S rRNA (guanosine(2251)-2'-O)-methyltransferase RlmB [Bacteroidales bacterium]|nr:23S rRNA (guanosine(2251)-2'-O)-methyltransferase RlmB [Bacteroidales bacterium]